MLKQTEEGKTLHQLDINDATTLTLEEKGADGISAPSQAQRELSSRANLISVFVTDQVTDYEAAGITPLSLEVEVEKDVPVWYLKRRIIDVLPVPVDENSVRLARYMGSPGAPYTDETAILLDVGIRDGTRVAIQQGPPPPDIIRLNFYASIDGKLHKEYPEEITINRRSSVYDWCFPFFFFFVSFHFALLSSFSLPSFLGLFVLQQIVDGSEDSERAGGL